MKIVNCAVAVIFGLLAAFFPVRFASASTYPERVITLVLAVTPGGAADAIGRRFAAKLSEVLSGRTVVVENRPGASGTIAAAAVARAAPDGYTLLLSSSNTHGAAPVGLKSANYDPLTDFTHIGLIGTVPAFLMIGGKLPMKTVGELVDHLRRHPSEFNYATSGTAGPQRFWAEMFMKVTNTKITNVPYKGMAPAMLDIAAGRIQINFDGMPSSLSSVRAGSLKPLAIMAAQRSPSFPEVPTMAEAGFPLVSKGLWYGLSGPPNLPPDVVETLSTAVMKIGAMPDFIKTLQDAEIQSTPTSPRDYMALIKSELEIYRAIAADAGITAE